MPRRLLDHHESTELSMKLNWLDPVCASLSKPAEKPLFCEHLNISTMYLCCCIQYIFPIGGHRHRSQCRRYPTSDIDICYSDIGEIYVGLKNVIPISEVFLYRHQSSFRYPTLKKRKYFILQIRTRIPSNGK